MAGAPFATRGFVWRVRDLLWHAASEGVTLPHDCGIGSAAGVDDLTALQITVDAFEQALVAKPRADHRHRIEHCSVLQPDQIERMVALGVSPSFLIGHIRCWAKTFGADCSTRIPPL